MRKRIYYHPDYTHPLSPKDVASADKETQIEIMRTWFFDNFENPAESTPYEGEYIYIWGGPYDARDELESAFHDIVSIDTIDKLVSELEDEGPDWAGRPTESDYDDYYLSVIRSNVNYYDTFVENVKTVKSLLKIDMSKELKPYYFNMIFLNVITILETYLSDAFINTTLADKKNIRKLVESNDDFIRQKMNLSDIFSRMEKIEDEIKDYLSNLIWHNIEKVKINYKNTLGIDFPADYKKIYKSIGIRHDIVHRNGRGKDGKEILLTLGDIKDLIAEVSSLVKFIDKQIIR